MAFHADDDDSIETVVAGVSSVVVDAVRDVEHVAVGFVHDWDLTGVAFDGDMMIAGDGNACAVVVVVVGPWLDWQHVVAAAAAAGNHRMNSFDSDYC